MAALLTKVQLKKRARKDIAAYERAFNKAECGEFPKIVPRSEAILHLREIFAHELIRPAAKGFVFEGFKGVNKMTNKELSKRLSLEPPVLDYIVWDDGEFHLLFGNRHHADENILGKMDLYNYPCWPQHIEEEEEA